MPAKASPLSFQVQSELALSSGSSPAPRRSRWCYARKLSLARRNGGPTSRWPQHQRSAGRPRLSGTSGCGSGVVAAFGRSCGAVGASRVMTSPGLPMDQDHFANRAGGDTHRSTRCLPRAQGVSKSTTQRAWQDHGPKPYPTKTFKLSRDPLILEKFTDIVGVYLPLP